MTVPNVAVVLLDHGCDVIRSRTRRKTQDVHRGPILDRLLFSTVGNSETKKVTGYKNFDIIYILQYLWYSVQNCIGVLMDRVYKDAMAFRVGFVLSAVDNGFFFCTIS